MTNTDSRPPLTPKEAKAQAQAAKAYAKAQQNWFLRHKILSAIGAIILIAIIASAAGGGGKDPANDSLKSSSDGNSTSQNNSASDPVGSESNPAPRGTAVENKSAKYKVDKVEVRDGLGQFADKPSGKYVVITITVENVKDETIQISSADFTLQVGGVQIDASDNAYVLDDSFSYDDLSPGLKRTGTIVFDVKPSDAGKGVLKAQALLSSDDAIYLSLE